MTAAAAGITVDRFAGSADEWDAVVRDAGHAAPGDWTHFHLYGWRTVIGEVLGHECPYLVARDGGGRAVGVLPLVRVRSRIFGHYLVSMPFLNYGGPIGSQAAQQALVNAAVRLATEQSVDLLELRSPTALPVELPVSHRRITVVLDLSSGGPEQIWKALDAKVRSQVRRPQKEGVEMRWGSDQVRPFFAVFARHMRDLGTPTQPLRLFEAIAATFPNDVWIGCAYFQGRPVAAGWGFRWRDEVEITWASALSAYNRIAPNMLLYWGFIERAAKEGCRLFNFGRCAPDSGTHRFKRQWGGRDVPLWWYQFSGEGSATQATPSPKDGAFAWGPRIWKLLPVPLATALGPRIVRFLP